MPAPPSDERAVFTGRDVTSTVVSVATTLILAAVVIPAARLGPFRVPWPWLLAAAALALTVAATGHRYRLVLSPDGIELAVLWAWVVPASRQRWLLDADIDLYESLEATSPEGICVESRRGPNPDASSCFGPGREPAIRAFHAAARAALERLRAAAPPCPRELRHPVLGPQAAALDVAGASRYPGGRLREIASVGPVTLDALVVPAGSRFRFNGEHFLDPRRDDRLVDIELGAPILLHGRETIPGAVIHLEGDGAGPVVAARGAFPREVEIHGRPVRGDETVGFTRAGALDAFTLAREATFGGFTLPAGSKLFHWGGAGKWLPPSWECTLGGPLPLPETTLVAGESCKLSTDLTRLIAISPRQDLVLPAGRVRAGVMSIPVHADGRVDVRACRKIGLLS